MSFFKVVITRLLCHLRVSGEHPYVELFGVRSFSHRVKPEDLKWHWDGQDRSITILHDTDWMFQYDNHLPTRLFKGDSFVIFAGEWHRLHKGTGCLTIQIQR